MIKISQQQVPTTSAGAAQANINTATVDFWPDVEGVYEAQVTVWDGCQATADKVMITVACANPPIPNFAKTRVATETFLVDGTSTAETVTTTTAAVRAPLNDMCP